MQSGVVQSGGCDVGVEGVMRGVERCEGICRVVGCIEMYCVGICV